MQFSSGFSIEAGPMAFPSVRMPVEKRPFALPFLPGKAQNDHYGGFYPSSEYDQ